MKERIPTYPMIGKNHVMGFAVCAHVLANAPPSVYETATPGELGLACCGACSAQGNETGFKLRLRDAQPEKLSGFEIVPASSMNQIGFMERIR